MFKTLGLAVYLSRFDKQKPMLEKMAGSGYTVFTSFHIQEEYETIPNYAEQAREMVRWLKDHEYTVLADLSPRSIDYLEATSIENVLHTLPIDMVRPDYGFSVETIKTMARTHDVVLNASTLDKTLLESLEATSGNIYAMHNFYPREETGLDRSLFEAMNRTMRPHIKGIIAFIPGDAQKRGPIEKGLPTLEDHRDKPPYVGYLDLILRHGCEAVFVGDIRLSETQLRLIDRFNTDGVISLPVVFTKDYEHLYEKVFTIRPDSPTPLKRLQESREYASHGASIEPNDTLARPKGTITIDNVRYQRYSGEIQITAADYPEDERINVIGHTEEAYVDTLESVKNNQKIRFVRLNNN